MKSKHWCDKYFEDDKSNPHKNKCKYCDQSYVGGSVQRRIKHHLKTCTKIPQAIRSEIDQKLEKGFRNNSGFRNKKLLNGNQKMKMPMMSQWKIFKIMMMLILIY